MINDVISEVTEDGQEITHTPQEYGAKYDMQVSRLDRLKATPPNIEQLGKLFKPKYTLNVTTEDGDMVQFVYRKLDPGTLMLTHGSPLAISAEDAKLASENVDEDGNLTADPIEYLTNPKAKALALAGLELQKNAVKAGVISPVITDEIYDNLDNEVIGVLYQAITGGITDQNDLVEYFRQDA